MQVILVKPVRKLGQVGETVTVANGYGRNYLVPQEFAIRATKENIEKFAAIQKDLEAKNSENKVEAEKAAKLIEGKHIDFVTQSAADGRLFGSVSAKSLAIEIAKFAGITLNYSNILLGAPIKFNGVYNVQIVLHPEVVTNILVVVAKSAAEAQDALREHKEGGSKKEAEAREAEMLALEVAAATAIEVEVSEAIMDADDSAE
ncbi:MAG: 50S ribosomal protein L9 [Rickettsiaceae bacterium]|nr:50S ribosomal protein L9 [Rickettsiaceae bacterium]MDP4832414.1 50S ribosomal protein L9 [Rickettsiaceae bacterium]MDP5020143.1 50S ribosomal protein L9 [Rickettsiaceae bacterium]MDP5082759.1 50S ribosomal protein L9 [Rickettsiaceae bacterium]